MKCIKPILTCALFIALLPGFSFADGLAPIHRSGDKAGNGGDPNELKFKSVAQNIAQWIESGNAGALALPAEISAAAYRQRMLEALTAYDIEFTNQTLKIGGGEKICTNRREQGGRAKITCDTKKFERLYRANIDDIYLLVHHEFAGLSGFEENAGQDSDYRISRQISGFLRTELVKRLPVRPAGEEDPFWLPATGWRQARSAGERLQPPIPFLLDFRGQESAEDLTPQGGYRSVAQLFARNLAFSSESARGVLVEAKSDSSLSITRKDGDRRLDASLARMPQGSPQDGLEYQCTIVETGESVKIPRGSGPIKIPSQDSIGLGAGKVLITAAASSFFVGRYGAGAEAVAKITRGAFEASIKFSGGGLPAISLTCNAIFGQ